MSFEAYSFKRGGRTAQCADVSQAEKFRRAKLCAALVSKARQSWAFDEKNRFSAVLFYFIRALRRGYGGSGWTEKAPQAMPAGLS